MPIFPSEQGLRMVCLRSVGDFSQKPSLVGQYIWQVRPEEGKPFVLVGPALVTKLTNQGDHTPAIAYRLAGNNKAMSVQLLLDSSVAIFTTEAEARTFVAERVTTPPSA